MFILGAMGRAKGFHTEGEKKQHFKKIILAILGKMNQRKIKVCEEINQETCNSLGER